jgi:serine/threonine protein kinase
MLDSSHNAKLGDFGLARLVDHGTGPQTTGLVQGTVGYIDPEFVSTFQRSTQSDVYSFGIVLLEIVSGRQPVNRLEPSFRLPKWVWSLYSQDLTLEAADTRLSTRDDDASERQMERGLVVGLWCAHPDPAERPSMAQAVHVLQSEDARLPALSSQMYRQVAPPSFAVGESGVSGSSLSSGVLSSSATTGVIPPSPE